MNCKICSGESSAFATSTLLKKHTVQFFRCRDCGFVQTEEPFWLDDAYSSPLSSNDVGLVARNITSARATKAIISAFFNSDGKFLDYGGGAGLFVRMMRDLGYDFRWSDKFATNVFARNISENPELDGPYELLTAFEVFEHLCEPLDEVREMLRLSDSILFTTNLLPDPCPTPEEWWYYGTEHGQHVALYTKDALLALARKFSLHLYTNGNTFHLLSKKRISQTLFHLVSKNKIAHLINAVCRKQSLIAADYLRITGIRLE